MGRQVGETHRECKGEVDEEEDNNKEEMEEERNDIIVRTKNKVHSQGGYFTKRHHFLGRGRMRE
jgi:Sec-independent protein translocase protein TatA